jgi:hypothetical protein
MRGPLRVVGLYRDEDHVERLGQALRLVEVERLHRDQVLAARAAEPQADLGHGLDVIGPLVDERHVVARPGEHAPDHAPDGARADDPDPHSR